MKSELSRQLSTANFIEDQGLQYGYLLSIFRCALQAAAYSSYEVAHRYCEPIDGMDELGRKLLQPSDGDLPEVINLLLPSIRTNWPVCATRWFDVPSGSNGQSGRSICDDVIAMRNDRLGHGVLDAASVQAHLAQLPSRIESLVEILSDLLPDFAGHDDNNATGILRTPFGEVRVEPVRKQSGKLVLVRKVENRGSVWRIRGQLLNHTSSGVVFLEMPDQCSLLAEARERASTLIARQAHVGNDLWRTSVVLPIRQTQTFEGRNEEIEALTEWWRDLDSRACLVYGEGGIGKTTLVLQFLNDLIDDPPRDLVWTPELIFFYSAKLSRWGVTGLEQLSGIAANINEALRSLARVIESRLGREWQTEDSRSLIARCSELFKGAGLNRDSILLVFDNTETLARNPSEEAQLGKILREVSTKLGKVIVTSRRREALEATQVQVPPMSEEVGAKLIGKLADAYGAKAIIQAGDSRRRRISRQFGGKPLLLDVLARHIANTGSGIDDGVAAILSQERGDLGAFLFEDAWKRMESSNRDVFLAIGQLGGTVSEQLLAWACAEFSNYAPNWLTAFEETRFGTLADYGANFDLTLDSGAREFLITKFETMSASERSRISVAVGHVRKKYQQALVAEEEKVSDRVLAAFRTTAAKAAKLAASRGDQEGAIKWYEEATIIDSSNAALFDRFAWYLMIKGELDRAVAVAKRACELAPRDADCQFTAGMIAARRGSIKEADEFLGRAEEHGKAPHLVKLQRARARLERAIPPSSGSQEERRVLLKEAINLIETADPSGRGNHQKHESERGRLLTRCHGLIESLRSYRADPS